MHRRWQRRAFIRMREGKGLKKGEIMIIKCPGDILLKEYLVKTGSIIYKGKPLELYIQETKSAFEAAHMKH